MRRARPLIAFAGLVAALACTSPVAARDLLVGTIRIHPELLFGADTTLDFFAQASNAGEGAWRVRVTSLSGRRTFWLGSRKCPELAARIRDWPGMPAIGVESQITTIDGADYAFEFTSGFPTTASEERHRVMAYEDSVLGDWTGALVKAVEHCRGKTLPWR